MEEKDAALEELRQLEKQLKGIERQIESLYEEQSVLETRKKALEQVLKRPVQEDRDWASSFPW
jgi:prefoldin subunit 5